MKKAFFFTIGLLLSLTGFCQLPGDTIEVATFNYFQTYGINQWSPGIRDTMIEFPSDTSIHYEKVLMLYNIRCKDGLVSPAVSGQTDIGCGEWDASCSTYITDSSRVDSVLNFQDSYSITGYSGSTYSYTTQATYNYVQYLQKEVNVDSIIAETMATVGSGTLALTHTLNTTTLNAKSQYLFTASELSAAGLSTGDINAIALNCLNAGGTTEFLKIRIKPTTKTNLSDTDPDIDGFIEVYFYNTVFVSGNNRLQFYTPFQWDGTSNLIVEFSFSNPSTANQIQIKGTSYADTLGLYSTGGNCFEFTGSNYLEADSYKGISGNTERTVEAWINTTVANKEICSWGKNSTGEKWVFRLNGDGTLRVEVNGGYAYGTTTVDDGEWHHVACVYTGTDVVDALLYIDGVLDPLNGTLTEAINTNTSEGINLRVSRGVNNRYFDGFIDDVRVWSAGLSVATLQDWMYKEIDSQHPNYANLECNYSLNEGVGSTITDVSGHQRNATVINGEAWKANMGQEIFKDFSVATERPNIQFMQGTYQLSIANDTLLYPIQNTPNYVTTNQIVPNWGSTVNDSIAIVDMDTFWLADSYEYVYDEAGNKLDSNLIASEGSLNITSLTYYKRFPAKYEIMSFVTPYGINLDLGENGKTWTFDVSDYLPILNGSKRMTVERGGQWMEDMDIRFLFIVGTPPRDILDIDQLWRVESKSYTSIMADQSYEPRDIKLADDAISFKVRAAITGHGQEGEFIPRTHSFDINNGAKTFAWEVWKECAENPVYPQGGTWIYDRAGWCPGMPTDVEEMDITPWVTAGQSTQIDYGVSTASGTSNYLVNAQLVSYGDANFTVDAAAIDVLAPSSKVEYARNNYICNNPVVLIQNTGSTTLTNLTIEYWVNNATQPETYTWSGSLEFLETQEVELPVSSNLWASISGTTNKFHVEVKEPNGTTDQYQHNNKYTSTFGLPDILPSGFVVRFLTNSAASESKYQLFDIDGNQLFVREGMSNNTLYRDTFDLDGGCYSLVVTDYDDDGIDFWANSDGAGYIQLREVGGGIIRYLEPDFGGSIVYNFSIDYPLSYDEFNKNWEVKLYPNPAEDMFFIEGEQIQSMQVEIYDTYGKRVRLEGTSEGARISFDTSSLSAGIYFVRIETGSKTQTQKLMIN